jgi:hypothetical protein
MPLAQFPKKMKRHHPKTQKIIQQAHLGGNRSGGNSKKNDDAKSAKIAGTPHAKNAPMISDNSES